MRALQFCTTCKFTPDAKTAPDGRTGGEMLMAEVSSLLAEQGRADVRVEGQACLWSCTKHCNVIFRDEKRFSYVAGGFAPTREAAEAIVAWFDLHGDSERGEVPFRTWPDGMRGHFITRLPPVTS